MKHDITILQYDFKYLNTKSDTSYLNWDNFDTWKGT